MMANYLAGVGAGRTPEFIEMMQVGESLKSGSARGALGALCFWRDELTDLHASRKWL